MAYQTRISNAAAIAACNAVVDLCDVGGAGYVVIYDGTQPTDPDTAVTTQNALATITLNNPAFGAAADATPGGRATADVDPALTDSSADDTGTAAWFRVFNNAGTAIWDGTVGTSGTDMVIDNTSITAGQSVTITSWTVTMAETEA